AGHADGEVRAARAAGRRRPAPEPLGRGRPALRARLSGSQDVVADTRDHGTSSVSVVICAYTAERWSRLLDAVTSVLRQSPAPDEVLVVVDHNRALEDRAREDLEPRGVRVVASLGARGLSGARNTGTGLARGDVVVFLDDDAAAEEG